MGVFTVKVHLGINKYRNTSRKKLKEKEKKGVKVRRKESKKDKESVKTEKNNQRKKERKLVFGECVGG